MDSPWKAWIRWVSAVTLAIGFPSRGLSSRGSRPCWQSTVTRVFDVVEGAVHDLQHTVALLKAGISAAARVTPSSMSTVSEATRTATWLGDVGSKHAKHDLTLSYYSD